VEVLVALEVAAAVVAEDLQLEVLVLLVKAITVEHLQQTIMAMAVGRQQEAVAQVGLVTALAEMMEQAVVRLQVLQFQDLQ
jgi:hypothetical protein